MRPGQIIPIAALLAVIFAAGVATGRLTAPRPPLYIQNATGRYATADVKLGELTRRVGLDAKQREQFSVLLQDIAKEMVKYPPVSRERMEIFRNSLPKQRALLRADQLPAFEEMVKQSERRYEQARRKRGQGTN